ncbi:MAG: hypothetical protein R3D27_10080 [Hyphomicrobiaceae bacterium]
MLDATGALKSPQPSQATSAAPAKPPTEGGSADGALSLSLAASLSRSEAPPLEVYSRIVRHSRGCWLGLDGVIETSHVLHADAAPTEKGGRVVVTIHERVVGGKSIWGARAFEIVLTPAGDATDIAMQNIKLADDRAAAMSRDVESWMHDRPGCRLKEQSPLVTAGPPLPVRRPPTPTHLAKRMPRKR